MSTVVFDLTFSSVCLRSIIVVLFSVTFEKIGQQSPSHGSPQRLVGGKNLDTTCNTMQRVMDELPVFYV